MVISFFKDIYVQTHCLNSFEAEQNKTILSSCCHFLTMLFEPITRGDYARLGDANFKTTMEGRIQNSSEPSIGSRCACGCGLPKLIPND